MTVVLQGLRPLWTGSLQLSASNTQQRSWPPAHWSLLLHMYGKLMGHRKRPPWSLQQLRPPPTDAGSVVLQRYPSTHISWSGIVVHVLMFWTHGQVVFEYTSVDVVIHRCLEKNMPDVAFFEICTSQPSTSVAMCDTFGSGTGLSSGVQVRCAPNTSRQRLEAHAVL